MKQFTCRQNTDSVNLIIFVSSYRFPCRHKKSSRRTRSPSKSRQTGCGGGGNGTHHHAEKFTYDERHIAKYRTSSACSTSASRMTPPLPDLRVDFFSESYNNQKHHVPMEGVVTTHSLGVGNGTGGGNPVLMEKRGSVCLNKCLREVCLDSLLSAFHWYLSF